MIKCELIIGGYSYKITDDVMNWDDVTISLKRGNYDGVVRSFTSKFEFVNTAYALLKKQYQDSYLGAAASIVISRRNNSWTWNELFRCTLDFSTYSDDGSTIAINAIDDTLAAIIKAKKSIQYEYPVADLHSEILHYDGLGIQNTVKWTNTGNDSGGISTSFDITTVGEGYCVPLGVIYSEVLIKNNVLFGDLNAGRAKGNSDNYLIKPETKGYTFRLKMDFTFWATYTGGVEESINMSIVRTSDFEKFKLIQKKDGTFINPLGSLSSNGWEESVHVSLDEEIILDKGESLILYAGASSTISNPRIKCIISDFKYFSLEWNDRITPANIDIIPLDVLANKLISSMAGEGTPYGVVIANYLPSMRVDRLSNTYIIAAESARGLPKAKLYTSFKKFTDFMEAEFGYVPVIKGNTIEFGWRNDLYTSIVQKDLGNAVNDYQYSVNSSLIYSSVKVGYDKQDYDSINGRDEFRFTNEFSTGLTLTENTFSLISPYRADAYGIEFLVQKRGEDTTDSDSDNDTFIVGCIRDGLKYVLKRNYTPSQLKGMISSETMFNIEYSPRFMLDANKSYIGACTKHLKFTSSNGNSDILINGIKETDDLVIESPLFSVGEIEVETSDTEVQDELNGLVSLTYNGSAATGYIKQLKINAGKEESVKYSLIVKDIKN